jgi:lipid-A-disaccharide synthase
MAQRLLLVAGEASGDLHGSHVARALLVQQPGLQLLGVGGRHMHEAGVEIICDVRDLAVVGAVEALHSVRRLWSVYHALLERVERQPVDAVLLIDFPGFNLKLAKAMTQRGFRVLYYIAPQIWAWRPGRIHKIRRRVRKLFVILPFEEALYRQSGIDAEFVGHPLLDVVHPRLSRAEFCARRVLDPHGPIVGLLPGSRRSEIRYLLPPMLEAAALIQSRLETTQFVLPLADTLEPGDVEGLLAAAKVPVHLVQHETYEAMQAADVLLATSGTVTLEAALLGTPMIIVYKAHPCTYRLARLVMRVSKIGLPNIIAGRAIVPELWQGAVTAENMAAQAVELLTNPMRNAAMRAALATIRSQLGAPGVAARVASGILEHLLTQTPCSVVGEAHHRVVLPER